MSRNVTELLLTESTRLTELGGDENQSQSAKNIVIENVDRRTLLHATTNMQTLMHLLKCMIGSGILAMPSAFLSAGLWMGFGLTFVIGIICLHCMNLLVRSSQILCRRTDSLALDYGDVAEISLITGPHRLIWLSRYSRYIVNTFVFIMQFGACSVYVVFVAANLKEVVEEYGTDAGVDQRFYMLVVGLALIPLVFIKHLTVLSILSTAANVLIMAGLVVAMQYIVRNLPDVSTRTAVNSTEYLPLFLGTTLFTFEGIGLVLPLENKMATPQDFGGWFGVLTLALTVATCFYTAMGFYGYLRYGTAVQGSITLNLPMGFWLYSLARVMFALSIFFTYLIQFYVPMTIIWPAIERKVSTRLKTIGEYVFRAICMIFTLILAIAVPHLDLLIALFGSLSATTLTIILPPLIDMIVLNGDRRLTKLIVAKNSIISLFGFVSCISGIVVSTREIIERY